MEPDIRWITAVFGTPETREERRSHIGVPGSGRSALQKMADELIGTQGQVALYVPEGTDEVYRPGDKRGRVIAAVKLLEMPPGRKMDDYFYDDWDGKRRWPIGWPCQLILAPPQHECPPLRDHVEHLFRTGSFGPYLARLQKGPFSLDAAMRERLNRDFAGHCPLP